MTRPPIRYRLVKSRYGLLGSVAVAVRLPKPTLRTLKDRRNQL